MRTGRLAGRADFADLLTGLDLLPDAHAADRTVLHMVIFRDNAVAVINFDRIAVTAVVAGRNSNHLAAHRGLDRRAGRSRNINGLVVAGGLAAARLERLTPAESTRDRAALDRIDGLVLALLVLRDLRPAPRVVLGGVLAVGRDTPSGCPKCPKRA